MKINLIFMLFIAISCSSKSTRNTCESANSADEMVAVGSWCVDKYEASVWSDQNAEGQPFFTNSDEAHDSNTLYPSGEANIPKGCMRDGRGCTQVAVSKKGVVPARGLTWMQAARFCANAGKELIPDHIWQVAAMGTQIGQSGTGGLTGGSVEDGESARCNTAPRETKWEKWLSQDAGVRPTGKAGKSKGSDKSCVSEFGVEDMVGNLLEMTGSNNLQAKMYADILEENVHKKNSKKKIGKLTPGEGAFTDQMTWGMTGAAYGCDGPDAEMGVCDVKTNVHAVALRGGSWHSGPYAGVKYISLRHNSAHSQWTIGFRCARPR